MAGGGTVLLDVIPEITPLLDENIGDVQTGVRIVVKALEELLRQIVTNAGLDGSVVCEKVKNSPARCWL